MATIVASYSETNQDDMIVVGSTNQWFLAGQSFTPTANAKLYSVKLYLSKNNSPTGNAVAKLYTHSGTYGTSSLPTTPLLATSNTVDVSTISSSYELVEFVFPAGQDYSLSVGTNYCIEVDYQNGGMGNNIFVGMDSSSPSYGGNAYQGNTNSGNNSLPGSDLCFYVYGNVVLNNSNMFLMF